MIFEQPVIQRLIAMATKQSYRPRQLIARGAEARQVYLLLEGTASVIVEHEVGAQAILDILHAGDFFGEHALCMPGLVSGTTVRARSSALVASLDREVFRRTAARESELALCMLSQLARRLESGYRKTADHFYLDVTERLRRTLIWLSAKPEALATADGMALRINRLELAAMLGCSREMIARGLRTLEAEGMVSADGHDVLVRPAPPNAQTVALRLPAAG